MIGKYTYKAQALLVVMLILVAGSIVALAMYSRTLKVRERTIQEKRSEEAAQYVDAINDMVTQVKVKDLLAKLHGESCWTNPGKCEYVDSDIETFLGSDINVSSAGFTSSNADNSETKLTFEKVTHKSEVYNVPKDKVKAIPIEGADSDCTYEFHFDEVEGAVVSLVYVEKNVAGDIVGIKPYEPEDRTTVCQGDCSTSGDYSGTWRDDVDEFSGEVDLSTVTHASTDYEPYEIRVTAVGAPLSFYVEEKDDDTCENPLEIRVVSSANNSGNYQSSYYTLPVRNSAPPIMDYVLFNGQGPLEFVE